MSPNLLLNSLKRSHQRNPISLIITSLNQPLLLKRHQLKHLLKKLRNPPRSLINQRLPPLLLRSPPPRSLLPLSLNLLPSLKIKNLLLKKLKPKLRPRLKIRQNKRLRRNSRKKLKKSPPRKILQLRQRKLQRKRNPEPLSPKSSSVISRRLILSE